MCEHELVAKYQALSQGTKVLESCLHHNLSEHINSEIGMGTITDIESAKRWLRDSFLYQRLRKNPNHYAIEDQQSANWQDRMDEIVLASIRKLQDHELVKQSGSNTKKALATTEYGDIMSKVHRLFLRPLLNLLLIGCQQLYIRQATVSSFTLLSPRALGFSDQVTPDDRISICSEEYHTSRTGTLTPNSLSCAD
jgi:ATP-dependent DNA helicase HFM1/MER3